MKKKQKPEPEQKQELCPECGCSITMHGGDGCVSRAKPDQKTFFCPCNLKPTQAKKLNLLNEMHLALKCASTVNANGPAPERADGGKAWGVTSPFQVKLDDMLSRAEKLLGKLE